MSIITSFRLNVRFALLALVCLISLGYTQQANAQKISAFPYICDFQAEGNRPSTSCGVSYTMLTPGWENESTSDDFDWYVNAGGTTSGSTGPNSDHTTGTASGKYMYTEVSGGCYNESAYIYSPYFDLQNTASPEFRFWYHQYGAQIGTLNVDVTTGSTGIWVSLFTTSGVSQNQWSQATIALSSFKIDSVRFRFRYLSGSSFGGDFAIDDVEMLNLVADDASVSSMTSPITPGLAGASSVDVDLFNFGTAQLTSADIDWSVNGVAQTGASFTGLTVATGASSNVNLGNYNFPNGLTKLKFWSSNPNGNVDGNPGNDTLETYFCTPLSGTYTVGTPTADFATISDAVDILRTCGVNGPVTFQVAPGTYNVSNELLINGAVNGASLTNTITFDGTNQGATLIKSSSGPVFRLANIQGVTVQNFTLVNTATTSSIGVRLNNNSRYNNIKGNNITVNNTSSRNYCIGASASATSATSTGNNAFNTLIENNTLNGGYYSIVLAGSTGASYNSANVIKNNDVRGYNFYGLYFRYQDSLVVDGNNILSGTSTSSRGIYAYYTRGSIFNANKALGYYGLYSYSSRGLTGQPSVYSNNMFISDGYQAVYFSQLSDTKIYHNSCYSNGSSYAVYLAGHSNTVNIRNNIFVSDRNYAFYSTTNTAFEALDYNCFFRNSNGNIIRARGSNYADITAWQANTFGYGQNSIEALPTFISATDLHVDGVSVNDLGDNTVNVLTDFDGDVRPAVGAASVDIGADEYTPPSVDAGVTDLLAPLAVIPSGLTPVEVDIKNFGIDTLYNFNVEWTVDGIAQTTFSYIGTPVLPGTSTNVALGSVNFINPNAAVRFWTANPNNSLDQRTSNDTLELNVCKGLSGTYTVGTPTSDFPTANEAITALSSCGVSGPVVMQFAANTYTGPWIIDNIGGSSATNTVTLDGMSSATTSVTHDASNDIIPTILINGADYLTIKNFTVQSSVSNNSAGILLTKNARYNQILDNKIDILYRANSNQSYGIVATGNRTGFASGRTGNNANYTLIKGNEITGPQYGILLEGNNGLNDGNQIIDNTIHNVDDYAIWAYNQEDLTIDNNNIYDVRSTAGDGIYLRYLENFEITNNKVIVPDAAVYLYGLSSKVNTNGLIANNMLSSTRSFGEGLYIYRTDSVKILHNTIRAYYGAYLYFHDNMTFKNNIVATTTGYCMYDNAVGNLDSDYNLYYRGTTGRVGRYNSTIYAALNAWVTATGQDANSIVTNPGFVAPAAQNGLYTTTNAGEDLGTTVLPAVINTDIDGQTRPMGTAPDMGADERITTPSDAAIASVVSPVSCGDSAQVALLINNLGSTLLDTTVVDVTLSGIVTASMTDSIFALANGTSDTIFLNYINTANGGVLNVEAIIRNSADGNAFNDTLITSITLLPTNQIAISATGDSVKCQNSTVTLSANANSMATIQWYDAATAGNLIDTGNVFTTAALTGNTTFYIAQEGCSSPRDSFVVTTVKDTLSIDLGLDTSICALSSINLEVTADSTFASYNWSTGGQVNRIAVDTAGTYSVVVTNQAGCQAVDTINVSMGQDPQISSVITDATCGSTRQRFDQPDTWR